MNSHAEAAAQSLRSFKESSPIEPMTTSTDATRLSFRARLQSLMVLGNLGGGVLTFLYFHYVDPMAVSGGVATTGADSNERSR